MTDQEREALVERMAQIVAEEATRKPWEAISHTGQMQWCDRMRAALAVAERVVREDEREACWNVAINEMLAAEADVETASDEDLVARLQSQGAASAAGRIATFIRARGAA